MSTRLVITCGCIWGFFCLIGCGRGPGMSTSSESAPVAKSVPDAAHAAPAFVISSNEDQVGLTVAGEAYERPTENLMLAAKDHPLSTFSIDVDTASYSNVRRFLRQRQLPPADAVRTEELINYFPYDDPQPDGETPFSVNVEVAGCPWNATHRLARIGLKGKTVGPQQRPGANIVFLVDVSGSMDHPKKLPLVKESMRLLVGNLGESDHVGIVVYAGAAGLVLPATSAANKNRILPAIDRLQAGGSTNGALGIRLAYDIARENFVTGGVNRVILCTDGDFNVGVTSPDALQRLIEAEAKTGVFLTVLGYGMGNLKDATMERLADRGNGNYGYIDNVAEARKLLVDQMTGTLITIAKDVKIQIEFNPAQVAAYRLIGYENRRLANRDFHDDTKDAGEIGAGHSVTALYEIVPAGVSVAAASAESSLRYQPTNRPSFERNPTNEAVAASDELFIVKLRYKDPDRQTSRLQELPIVDRGLAFEAASTNLRFAAAVAQFGMLLTGSGYRGETTFDQIVETARSAIATDPKGYRAEFLELVTLARDITNERLLSRRDRE